MTTTENNNPSPPPPSSAVESRHEEQQRRPLLPLRHDDEQRAAAAVPRQRRHRNDDDDDDQNGTTTADDERTHLSPSFLPSSTVSSSSSHLTRLPPPLPTRGGGSSISSRNNQDGEEEEDTAAVTDGIGTAAATEAEATMPFLLHRGEDGSVPTDDEIVAALSANIDLLASAMRRDGEMTDTYESEIQEMKQMLSMTEGMLEEADANMDTPPATTATTAAAGGEEGNDNDDTRSNAIAYVDQHRQIAVSSSPNNNDEGASTLPAPAVTTVSSSSSRNQQDTGSDQNATAITGKTPRTSLTPSYLQEAVGISTEGRAAEMANLSDQEKKALFEDLYGRKPDGIEKVERLLLAVDEELERIPPEEKTATIVRAREEYPSPFHSSRHILLFLNVEDFDPKRAARVRTRPM